MTTDYEEEGRAPVLMETFNTFGTYVFTVMSGVLSTAAGKRFMFLANADNSSNVLIGKEAGAINFPMEAGLGLVLEIENLNQVFADIQDGDKLHVLVLSEV